MNILFEISRGIWSIDAESKANYLPLVESIMNGKGNTPVGPVLRRDEYFPAGVVGTRKLIESPESVRDSSIFCLDITGVITKYDQPCGPLGVKQNELFLRFADSHPNIFAHIIRIDSGGGEQYAARSMAQTIKSLEKPVIAFVEDMVLCSAYQIAAATDYICANSKQAQIGAVGTVFSIMDSEQYLKKKGLRIIDVYADQSTDKNLGWKKAIKGDTSEMKQKANFINNELLKNIASYRAGVLLSDEWKTGKTYFADEALKIGLIDSIAGFDNVIQEINAKMK